MPVLVPGSTRGLRWRFKLFQLATWIRGIGRRGLEAKAQKTHRLGRLACVCILSSLGGRLDRDRRRLRSHEQRIKVKGAELAVSLVLVFKMFWDFLVYDVKSFVFRRSEMAIAETPLNHHGCLPATPVPLEIYHKAGLNITSSDLLTTAIFLLSFRLVLVPLKLPRIAHHGCLHYRHSAWQYRPFMILWSFMC